jgi:hypothetical protein
LVVEGAFELSLGLLRDSDLLDGGRAENEGILGTRPIFEKTRNPFKIHLSNIPKKYGKLDLKGFLSNFGVVKKLVIFGWKKKEGQKSGGDKKIEVFKTACVEFENLESAGKLIQKRTINTGDETEIICKPFFDKLKNPKNSKIGFKSKDLASWYKSGLSLERQNKGIESEKCKGVFFQGNFFKGKITKKEYKENLRKQIEKEKEEIRKKLKPGELEPVMVYQSLNRLLLKVSKKRKFNWNHRIENIRICFKGVRGVIG